MESTREVRTGPGRVGVGQGRGLEGKRGLERASEGWSGQRELKRARESVVDAQGGLERVSVREVQRVL